VTGWDPNLGPDLPTPQGGGLGSGSFPAVAPDPTAVDPELLALPAPPRGRRLVAMTLMAAVVGLSVGLATSVRPDVSYALQTDEAQALGDVTALDPAALTSNHFVRVRGTPMLGGMVHFKSGVFGTEQVVFPLAGQRNVFVQMEASALSDARSGSRNEFAGRLITFGELGGRFRVVREFLAREVGMPVTGETFLLVADDPPATHAWSLFFAAFCLGLIALNVWLFSRWFRPLPKR
jgi:hypothetical protein